MSRCVTDRMRVLFISTTYPTPYRPRQGAFNQALITELQRRHDVQVISPVPWVQTLVPWVQTRVPWVQTRVPWTRQPPPRSLGVGSVAQEPESWQQCPTFFYPPKLARPLYGKFYSWSCRTAMKQAWESLRPQLVLAYWAHPDGEAAVDFGRQFDVPSVIMVGGSDIRLLTHNRARGAQIRRVLQSTDRVVALSSDLAHRVEQLGIPRERIDLIYRGIDTERFHPGPRHLSRARLGIREETVLVLWVGRLVAVKHPELLLQAACRWRSTWGRRLQVMMIGEGPLRRRLEQLAGRLGVADAVTLRGGCPQAELADWYRASNVTALTSHSEGVPNVLLESIACGRSFVATDVGGVREIADESIDRVVGPADAEAFADAVLEVVQRETADSEPQGVEAPRTRHRRFQPDSLTEFAQRVLASGQQAMESFR